MSKEQTNAVAALHPAASGDGPEGTVAVFNGRPPAYHEGMIDQVQDYIDDCPDVVPSIAGLSFVLGVRRESLEVWKGLSDRDSQPVKYPRWAEFSDMLKRVKDLQEFVVLNKGATGEINSTIAKLILAKHGYHDKSEVVGQGSPTVQIVMPASEAVHVDSEVVKEIDDE